jgi:hypothetical protein
MSEVLTKFSYKMDDEWSYNIIKKLFVEKMDVDEGWPVEEYNSDNNIIEMEEVMALEGDVVELANKLNNILLKIEAGSEGEVREKIGNLEFILTGTLEATNSGENIAFSIKRENKEITIQETPAYLSFGSAYFGSYDEFCSAVKNWCDAPSELCSEDEFDPDCEYAVVYNKLYVDEEPEYTIKSSVEEYKKRHGLDW